MAISYVNVATWTNNTSSTTFTFNKPSGVQEGDLLLAYVITASGGFDPGVSGWTVIYDGIGAFGSGNDTWSAAYWRTVDGTEGSSWTSNTFSGGATVLNTVVVAYRGVHPTDPIVAHDSSVPGGMGTTPLTDNPAFTVEDVGGWVVNLMGYRSSASSTTSSHNLGFTERSDVSAGTGSTYETMAVYDSNAPYDTLGGVFCQVTSTQTAVSGGTYTVQLRPKGNFPVPTEPELRGFTTTSGTSTAQAFSSMPPHRAGDLLLCAAVCSKSSGTIAPTINNGWTEVGSSNGTTIETTYWAKFATSSSESAPTISNASATRLGTIAVMASFRYVDVFPTIVAGTGGTTTASPHSTSAVTTTSDNNTVVRIHGVVDSTDVTQTWASSTEMTEIGLANVGGALSEDMSFSIAYKAQPTAGSSGTENMTLSSAPTKWRALTVALSNSFRAAAETGTGADAYVKTTVGTGTDSGTGTDGATKQVAGPNPGTDTGTGTDVAGTLKVSGAADTGTGSDAATVKVSGAADSGSSADTASVKPGGAADTGSGTDVAGTVLVSGATDSGTTADTAALTATIPAADTGAGVEASTVRVSSAADTGTSTESVNSAFGQDTGTGLDTAINVRVSSATDSGSSADTAISAQTALAADTGAASAETATVRVSSAADSAEGSDTVLGFGTDDAAGDDDGRVRAGASDAGSSAEDAISSNSAPSSDTGSSTEASTLRSAGTETITSAEAATLRVGLGTDTGTGTDSATVAAVVPGSDTGTDAENAGPGPRGTDTGTGNDNAILQVYIGASDTGTGTDTAATAATFGGSDTGSGTDLAQVIVQGAETSVSSHVATIRVGSTDPGSIADNGFVGAATVIGSDSGLTVDDARNVLKPNDTGTGNDDAWMLVAFGPVFGPRAIRIDPEERVLVVERESRLRTAVAETRLVFIGKELLIPRMNGSGFDISTESRVAKVKAETRVYLAPEDEE